MYYSHFGLNKPPFKITPSAEFFYTGGNRGAILDGLVYAITHGEGIVKVIGEVGCGKTMLCRMLENLLPDNVEIIYLATPSLGREDIFYVIASELKLDTEGKRVSEVLHLMQQDLLEKHTQGKQVVILIEEAQAMPLDTLEEIRLISNLETGHHKLLQIVLFGQPELDENLALPRMRQLKERITHSFQVPPFTKKEIPDYLMFRVRAAGYHGPDIFTPDAVKLIGRASKGITRRINILADKTLLAAFSQNTHNVHSRHVKAAIRDSEFSGRTKPLLKKIGLFGGGTAVALLTGLALGLTWQQFVPPARLSSPILQTPPAPTPSSVPNRSAPLTTPPPRQVIAPVNPQPGNLTPPAPASGPGTNGPSASPAPEPAKATTTAPTPAAPPAKPETASSPAKSTAAPTLLQQQLEATKIWLANSPGATYTVQLLLTDTDASDKVEQFLREAEAVLGSKNLHVYPTSITAKRQFCVTYGSFASQKEAAAAAAKLPMAYEPNQLKKYRTVKGIQGEIEYQRKN